MSMPKASWVRAVSLSMVLSGVACADDDPMETQAETAEEDLSVSEASPGPAADGLPLQPDGLTAADVDALPDVAADMTEPPKASSASSEPHEDDASADVEVAESELGPSLIASATWVYDAGRGFTLQVKPTRWARAQPGSIAAGIAGWNELYRKYKNRGLNRNLNGMRDQYICHQHIVAIRSPRKKTWNLDEWRPDVSYLQTVNARCNPGGGSIFD